jgi:hypothetical protein
MSGRPDMRPSMGQQNLRSSDSARRGPLLGGRALHGTGDNPSVPPRAWDPGQAGLSSQWPIEPDIRNVSITTETVGLHGRLSNVTSARTSEEQLEGSEDITDLLTGSTALACGSRESRVLLLSNSTGRCVSLAVSHS